MNTRQRAETFTLYVGLELKGKIVSQGFTAQKVAETIGRSPAAFNRWLNGKSELPLSVLCEACEIIDVEPRQIVETAYDRMAVALGERDGDTYGAETALAAVAEAEAQRESGTVHEFRPRASGAAGMVRAASDADIDSHIEGQQEEP